MSTTTVKFRSGKEKLQSVYIVYRHNSKDQAFPTGLRADKSANSGHVDHPIPVFLSICTDFD